MNARPLATLSDLKAWDRWLPLGVVALFVDIGAVVYAADITFGIPEDDVERFHIIYTEIGIQTTAGIFAIIVSLSLVAIQFAAQEYSHRIMEYYLRSTVFWTTLVVYLGVMIASIFLQAAASDSESPRVGALVIVGSVLAFALLIPHFLITAAYLKPEFVIGKLIKRIDDRYLRLVSNRGLPEPPTDRLLPIIEIVERAIDRGDLTTTRGALEQVSSSYVATALPIASSRLDQYYLEGLLRAGRKAISQSDEQQAAVFAMSVIGRMGTHRSPASAIDALEELGFGALRRDAEVAVNEMITAVREVSGAHDDPELRAAVMATYGELSRRLVAADQQRLLRALVSQLGQMAITAFNADDAADSKHAVELLEELGHDAAIANMGPVVAHCARTLQELGVVFAKTHGEMARSVALSLLRVERALNRNERDLIATIEFARAEVDRAAGPASPQVPEGGNEGPPEVEGVDVSDLWDEPED